MEYEESEENDRFSDFDEFGQARENMMILERDGQISFEEVKVVMEYIDLKLTQKVSCQNFAQKIRSEA